MALGLGRLSGPMRASQLPANGVVELSQAFKTSSKFHLVLLEWNDRGAALGIDGDVERKPPTFGY